MVDCIISGNPKPKISWYKDGILLKISSSKMRLSNQLLVIMSFDYRDEGVYACQASNRLGTVRTTAHLTVRPRDMSTGSTSKMASDVFISIIIAVVVVVILLTSLAWVTLICFCRKRRNRQQEKRENHFVNYPGEALLSELPKDYVLRCNGKLVTVQNSEEMCEDSTDALLSGKSHHTRAQEDRGHFYSIPMLGSRQQIDNEDDSGISLVYTKYPRDTSKYPPDSSRDSSKYPHEPAVAISTLDERSHKTYQLTTITVDNNLVNNKETIPTNFPCDKDRRKSKPPLSSHHPPKQGGPFIDNNPYSEDKYLVPQKKQSDPNRVNNKHNSDFDPVRLKLQTAVKGNQGRFTDFSSDSVQDSDDYYHSYVTSSSGIESGGSSENVSLNSEENISANGVVAV